ncbi:MAG: hypothetical protein J7530_20155 [Novosphingobium sp.]|nr:hypothetical protein [Novosphingobium sp.]
MSETSAGSLRARLIFASVVGVVAAMALAGVFIGNLYRIHTTDRYQAELDHHLSELVALVEVDLAGRLHVRKPLSDPQFLVTHSGLYWQIDAEAQRLQSSSLANLRLGTVADGDWRDGLAGDQPVRQRSLRVVVKGRPMIVTIASARRLLDDQVELFRPDLTLSMGVVGLLLLAGAIAVVHFGLAPVRRLSEDVDRLRKGEARRLDDEVPSEFVPVITRFNALLEGQEQLITRARTEAGNLAHNLRTPLALAIDEAEQLRLAGQIETSDFLLSQCAAMKMHIDYHLGRASAAGTRGAGTMTEVEPLVREIVGAMRRLHADRPMRVTIDLPPDLHLSCDRGDLGEILSNLIDNAFKWASGHVIVSGGADFVEVRDDGHGIPVSQRDRAVDVGTRLDPSAPGTGLGLAATADLLRFYQGGLELDDAVEGGLRARACL